MENSMFLERYRKLVAALYTNSIAFRIILPSKLRTVFVSAPNTILPLILVENIRIYADLSRNDKGVSLFSGDLFSYQVRVARGSSVIIKRGVRSFR
jgi:hypothetical protein